MSKRVAVYARVSTARQADDDISIPDQLAQGRRFCDGRRWSVVREFVDAGASATNDNRLIHDSIALVERGYLKLLRGL